MIQSKEEAPCSTNLGTDTMVCGWTIFLMDREEWYTRMEMSTKVCGIWEKEAVMEFLLSVVEIISKDTGSTIRGRVRGHTSSAKRIKYSWESGSMMPQKLAFTLKWKIQLLCESRGKSISQIHTYCHLLIKSAFRILQLCLKRLLKRSERIEQFIEPSTFLLTSSIQKVNFWNSRRNSELLSMKDKQFQSSASRPFFKTWA